MAQVEQKFLGKLGLPQLIAEIKSGFAALVHTHTKADITDLEVDITLSSTSENPVQNKVVNAAIEDLATGVAYVEITGTETVENI